MELLNEIAFVKRAKNRKEIFLALHKPMMPSEIVLKLYKKNNSSYFVLVSRALAELKTKKLVEVVNPEEKTGRIYQRTKLGEKVVRELN